MQNKIITQGPEYFNAVGQQLLIAILKEHVRRTADHGLPATIDSLDEYAKANGFKSVRKIVEVFHSLRDFYHWYGFSTRGEDRIYFNIIRIMEKTRRFKVKPKYAHVRNDTKVAIAEYFGSYEKGVSFFRRRRKGSTVNKSHHIVH